MEETPRRVLVITPHPDDAEIWCGGTLARWIKRGAEVYYVQCTDGGKGTDKRGFPPRSWPPPGGRNNWTPLKFWGSKRL